MFEKKIILFNCLEIHTEITLVNSYVSSNLSQKCLQ